MLIYRVYVGCQTIDNSKPKIKEVEIVDRKTLAEELNYASEQANDYYVSDTQFNTEHVKYFASKKEALSHLSEVYNNE